MPGSDWNVLPTDVEDTTRSSAASRMIVVLASAIHSANKCFRLHVAVDRIDVIGVARDAVHRD
jgi:hypothetical protein